MKRLKQIIIITFIFLILAIPISNIYATDIVTDYNPDNITTNSPSVILMDASTGKILYSKNAFEKRYPASTTKLMTAILALENCKLTDVATVSHDAIFNVPVGYSHANLQEGERLTIEQLLKVLLIPSANDAAFVIAEHIAGSVDKFSEMMNNKAKELGCMNTHFVNPNGIHDEDHYSTAYDLALIGQYAMKFDKIMEIAKINHYKLPKTNKYTGPTRIFNATNGLIDKDDEYYYSAATGLKTGYTDKSGYCIVSSAEKGELKLLEVVLGSENISTRYEDCINLFDYGFNNYSYKKLLDAGTIINNMQVDGATKETKSLNIVAKDDINVLTKNDINVNSLEPQVQINSLTAPIEKDAVIGKLTYTIGDETYSTDLIAGSKVVASNIETIIFRVFLIFLILFILVIILRRFNKPKKRNRAYEAYKREKVRENNPQKGGRYKFTQISDYL